MKVDGLNAEVISKYTGLSIEEIEKYNLRPLYERTKGGGKSSSRTIAASLFCTLSFSLSCLQITPSDGFCRKRL